MSTQISAETISPIMHNQIPVITTDLLAQLYGTESVRIRQNHSRNESRFVAGKHYFLVEGGELRELKHRVSQSYSVKIARNVRSLVLWTERGAARHAKMLETDQAWEVFEKLEDCYFSQKETAEQIRKVRQCTARQLIPLRQTVERLITIGVGQIYPDIWKLVHQRFGVEHIHQLRPEQVSEAVGFLNGLEGEYLAGGKPLAQGHFTSADLCALCWLWNAAEYMREHIELIYPALESIKSEYAAGFYAMASEYRMTLEDGRRILERETQSVIPHPDSAADADWRRVLPRLRRGRL
ncbi:putative phage protein [Trabulsiella guamensis ATCC 49490]|uniref:Putative phage protein n=1 Tax=Trabulsiella guamensis ATCC 49490 TaxID=1005994 RepID=A0A085AFM0_9ENTR|nr:ORF6N domain-containing protein [Trabulsiella guamensis]KFC09015.1 putative phage protein [Trabulsiella guamensis ATCC 49490]